MNKLTLDILKTTLWQTPVPTDEITQEVYQELFDQTLLTLVFDTVESCNMDSTLHNKWMGQYAHQLTTFNDYMEEQKKLVHLMEGQGYKPAILKGLSAAMYYPEPAYRAVGDIDFLLYPRDAEAFSKATELLKEKGYTFSPDKNPRHLGFSKNGFDYEMHRYFSHRESEGELLLDKIIDSSTIVERKFDKWPDYPFYSFPDEINGLIFLQHIKQHLVSGLGLRQIIDWLYYVEAVVTEEFWQQTLKPLTDRVGLTTLAITVTRMCEIYLGAPIHTWAQDADKDACNRLFILIDESGNFGRKMNRKDNRVTTALNQRGLSFKGLQQRGLYHWTAAQKHKFLRPFAWIYQICRYIKEGLFKRDPNSEGLFKSFKRHREQKKLFKKLGLW